MPEVVPKAPSIPPPSGEDLKYSRLTSIFRSFFWRFYDNLFSLVLLNLVWFLAGAAVCLLFWRCGFIRTGNEANLFGIYSCYLTLCLFSVGWASVVFRVFNDEPWSWKDIWKDTLRYGGKALVLSALAGVVFLLALLSLRYYSHLWSSSPILRAFLIGVVSWSCLFWAMAMLYQWPILFFQNPPLGKILYRSVLLALSRGFLSLALLFLFGCSFLFFSVTMVPWFFFGGVYFFSLQCVALEKIFLEHKIVLNDKPLEQMLGALDRERARGWTDFIKPWENR